MNAKRWVLGAALFGLASSSMATVVAASSFSAGAMGWTAQNSAGLLSLFWNESGGAPGGFIDAVGPATSGNGAWFFSAPAGYLYNQSADYGGTLSFLMKSTPTTPVTPQGHALIQLLQAVPGTGPNASPVPGELLVWAGPNPGTNWTPYMVNLVADGSWKVGSINGPAATAADFKTVLSSVLAVRIAGDFVVGSETTSLDSVVLTSPSPVPEPGTAAMGLAGIAVLGGLLSRRRRSLGSR